MKEITLKVKHHFYASHQLKEYEGKCQKLHGHTWNVEICARGTELINGILIDFSKIKDVVDVLDHNTILNIEDKDLGDYLKDKNKQDVIYLKGNPTAENIGLYLLDKFEVMYPDISFKIIVWESPSASAEVKSVGFNSYK